MSVYAKNNGIRIYAITFAYQPVSECTNVLAIMANGTGGFYAHAPNGATLTQSLYKDCRRSERRSGCQYDNGTGLSEY